MGLLISLLKQRHVEDVFLDFQKAEPSEKEKALFEMSRDTLVRGEEALHLLQEYQGAQELSRKAMGNAAFEEEAFVGLVECVRSIKRFHQFAVELEGMMPQLLLALAEPSEDGKASLADQQALALQLARVMDFILRFDALRMQRPHLANDFSYYKRLLPKFKKHPLTEVKEDEAQKLQMFTMEHIPMMTCTARATAQAVNTNEHVTMALACMANSCLQMIRSKRFDEDNAINLLCARAMTGAIVLFDHVDPLGVFHRNSPIQTRACIQLLKKDFPQEQALLNAVRFSSKHFNDGSTPSNIQSLFD